MNDEYTHDTKLNKGEPEVRLSPSNVGNMINEGEVNEAITTLVHNLINLKLDPKFKTLLEEKDYERIFKKVLNGFLINAEGIYNSSRLENEDDFRELKRLLETIRKITDSIEPDEKEVEEYPIINEFNNRVLELNKKLSRHIKTFEDEIKRGQDRDAKGLGEQYT